MYNQANFFWIGNLSNYEILTLKSYISNGFEVKLWTYENKIPNINIIKDLDLKIENAEKILEEDLIYKFSQGSQKASPASFANLFRLHLMIKEGGWWFDLDCVCLKNVEEFKELAENLEFVLGAEYENYIGNSVMYFKNKSIAKKLIKEIDIEINKNNYNFYWGQIGPDLITEYFLKNNLMHLVVEKKYFYNTEAKDFKYFLESKNSFKSFMIEKHNPSLTCHLWNEMFNKYSYNKNFMPPKNSFLDQLFISYYPECSSDKRYGKSVMWRFLPLINYFYKLIYKIKIYRRNYEILKS